MPELECGRSLVAKVAQECFESRKVLLETGVELKQHRSQSSFQHCCRPEQVSRLFLGAFQAFDMRDGLRCLERESKSLGHLRSPRLQKALAWHPAKRIVDLNRSEPLGVIAQHFLPREFLRVEASLPLRVAVSTRADKESHGSPQAFAGSSNSACGVTSSDVASKSLAIKSG